MTTNSFSTLGLEAALLRAVAEEGYETPTPIQAQAIPQLLEGRDLLGCAQTGTGKTAAFTLPILQLLASGRRPAPYMVKALVVTPTRELAIQIDASVAAYGRFLRLSHTAIFGGVSQGPQVRTMRRGVDVLTATPGRLLDLINQQYIDLSGVEILVLDEADRMLDMGFIHDIKRIIAAIPDRRQTLLFSATMPRHIADLAQHILRDPVRVDVDPASSTVERIEQRVLLVERPDKTRLLAEILSEPEVGRALVFTRTKHGANKVVRQLGQRGIGAQAIHGNKSQGARQKALEDFRAGRTQVLIATDIAARGIDVDDISHVINYDLPNEAESYVHRIGRTARAGREGQAISFCQADERPYLRGIERLIKQKVEVVVGHAYESNVPMDAPPAPRSENRASRPGRPRRQMGQAARRRRRGGARGTC